MPQIGAFTGDETGLKGYIRSALLDMALVIIPADKQNTERAPAFRIHLGDAAGPEIGAAWAHTGDKAGRFLSVLIDDPSLPQPLRANLFRDGETSNWSLRWTRPPLRTDRVQGQ